MFKYLSRINPGNDANHGEEEAEDEVHRHHSPKSVVVGIGVIGQDVILGEDRIDEQCERHTNGRDDQGLDTPDFVEQVETKSTPDNGEGSGDSNNLQCGTDIDPKKAVDLRPIIIDDLQKDSSMVAGEICELKLDLH